jgi:uncharacterized protein (DUF885 family)
MIADLTAQALSEAPEAAGRVPESLRPARQFALLGDRSIAAEEVRRTAALRRLAQLGSFDGAEVPPAQRRRHAALLERFKAQSALAALPFGRLDPDGCYRPYAIDPVHAAHLALPALFDASPPFAALASAQDFIARLGLVPAALAADVAKLQTDATADFVPPLALIDRAIALIEAIATLPLPNWPFRAAFVSRAIALVGPLDAPNPTPDAARALGLLGQVDAMIRDQIAPQYLRASQALRALRPKAPAEPSFARAPDALVAYQRALDAALGPGVDLTIARGQAETRLTALLTELDVVLRGQGLAEGGVGARLAQLRSAPQSPAGDPEAARGAILAGLAAASARAGAAFANGFGSAAPPTLGAIRAPIWREALGLPPVYQPAHLTAPAQLLAPLADPARQSPLDLAWLAWKEGAPGRHLAFSLWGVAGDPSTPLLVLTANASVIEGWCVYALDVALDMGLAQTDPALHTGVLRGQLLAAAGALLELDLNAAGAAYEPALARYIEATGSTRTEAERTAERILSEPGAGLAGEIGRQRIAALKERARSALADRFDAKSFHTALLAAMPGPPSYLAGAIEDWIRRR